MLYIPRRVQNLHILAKGVFARDVPSRNLRSWSLVSCEKVYSLDSDCGDERQSADVVV